jgi:hypothetical protein
MFPFPSTDIARLLVDDHQRALRAAADRTRRRRGTGRASSLAVRRRWVR